MSHHKDTYFGLILAALAGFLLYLLSKSGLLHEAVSSSVGGLPITQAGTVPAQAGTGLPQFSSAYPNTAPAGWAQGVAPIDQNGNISGNPANPSAATCPLGYELWHDIATDTYICVPNANDQAALVGPSLASVR